MLMTRCPHCDVDIQVDGSEETLLHYNLLTGNLTLAPGIKLGCMWCGHVWVYYVRDDLDYLEWVGNIDND